MPTQTDGAKMRSFTDMVDIVRVYANLSGSTTTTVTYTPPNHYFFVFVSISVGPNIMGWLRGVIYLDNTLFFDTASAAVPVTGGWALDNVVHYFPSWYAKNSVSATFTNADIVTHTFDFALIGILVPWSRMEEYKRYMSDQKLHEELEGIRRQLELLNRRMEK